MPIADRDTVGEISDIREYTGHSLWNEWTRKAGQPRIDTIDLVYRSRKKMERSAIQSERPMFDRRGRRKTKGIDVPGNGILEEPRGGFPVTRSSKSLNVFRSSRGKDGREQAAASARWEWWMLWQASKSHAVAAATNSRRPFGHCPSQISPIAIKFAILSGGKVICGPLDCFNISVFNGLS
jgi:hypothetical protein